MSSVPRTTGPEGAAAIARLLARAFVDDPGWIYLFPDERTRLARLERTLAPIVRTLYARLGDTWVIDGDGDGDGGGGGDPVGAAVWAPAGADPVGGVAALALGPRLGWVMGRRLPRALRLLRAMAGGHPDEPHAYLAMLGVDPSRQGRGLGARLIAPMLARCDDRGTLAWLESTNPGNHAFYRRMGFEVARQRSFPGGPTLTFFARRPR